MALSLTPSMIMPLWRRLSALPGGKLAFSKAVGRAAPYTGSINARVEVLEPGYARVRLKDRPNIRNHLRSIHAVALINLAEETSGLAMLAALPATVRGIVTGLSMEYLHKARGELTAECRTEVPEDIQGRVEHPLDVVLKNAEGREVARARATWLLSPVQPS